MEEKIKIKFYKCLIRSKKWFNFFNDLYNKVFEVKGKKIKEKTCIILRPKINDGSIYVSKAVSSLAIEYLFKYASISDFKGNIIVPNKYEDYFEFEGIDKIENYDILISENMHRKDGKFFSQLDKYFLLKNHKEWFLRQEGETEPSFWNWYHYSYFVDKKN